MDDPTASSEQADVGLARKAPPARLLSRLMTAQRVQLTKADAVTVAAIETGVPPLAVACERFHRMLRTRDVGALRHWLADTGSSLLASFGKGIAADLAAVTAALAEPWSNGQTEGQIIKLKLVKRQMYGRARLDLLRARLVALA
jgi:transposase